MKKLFFALATVCFASIFAMSAGMHDEYFKKDLKENERLDNQKNGQSPVLDQGHPVKKHQMRDAYSAPGRINTNNPWNFFLWGKFLYWQALQEEMSLGKNYTLINGVENGHVVNMSFDYTPAFKVGLGFHFTHDDWSLLAEYTRYYSINSHTERSSDLISVDQSWWPNAVDSNYEEMIYGKWTLQMNLIDLHLMRSYYLGTHLLLLPYFGMRVGLIDQKLDAYYMPFLTTDQVYCHAKSTSWAVGPRAGIDLHWYFAHTFFLYSNLAASLPYTQYKVYHKAYYEYIPEDLDWNYSDKYNFLRPNLELILGLAWGDYIYDNKVHLDIFAGYEFHTFWGQNMMKFYADKTQCNQLGTAYPGNLYLHGLSTGMLINW